MKEKYTKMSSDDTFFLIIQYLIELLKLVSNYTESNVE